MGREPIGRAAVLAVLSLMAAGCGAGSDRDQSPNASPPIARDGSAQEDPDGRLSKPRKPKPKALAGKVIVLDPGHNGGNARNSAQINRLVNVITERKPCDTAGAATNAGYAEHAFNWDVTRRLTALLRARGAKVVLTRPDDVGVGPCITERAAIGNRARADVAVSVHADGGPPNGQGFHVIEPRPIPGHNVQIVPASRKLGLALRDAYAAGTGIVYSTYIGKGGLDARDDLGGLNLSKVPKVFIECGNMRHTGDAARLSAPAFRQRIAQSLADGLAMYFS